MWSHSRKRTARDRKKHKLDACANCASFVKVLHDVPDPAWRRGEWYCVLDLVDVGYARDRAGQPWDYTCDVFAERGDGKLRVMSEMDAVGMCNG